MFPTKLSVPRVEINFDTPNRDRFLRDEFPHHNRYTVLGRGSYGVVIKARYKGKSVAVKIVEKQKKYRCRYDSLRNEANVLNLKHENIVRVLKIISGAQYGLVIMERFDGHCLQNILNENYIITIYHRLMILCDIINGLCFCHRNHIVHLDVKPQNVIVCLLKSGCQSGGQCTHVRSYTCKLCDFGSSFLLNNLNLNEKSSHRGTIRYMAPELLRGMGNISEIADIYSFGITMWQLSEGKNPYGSIASNEAVAYNVVKKKLRPDSVTTADILRTEPVTIPTRKINLLHTPEFRARKNSDNTLEMSHANLKPNGNSTMSLRSNILTSANSTAEYQQPNVECAAAAMSDVLKQQGIDLVGPSSVASDSAGGELDHFELSAKALDELFVPVVDVDQNYIRQEYRALFRKCWQHEAALRPTASTVRSTLHGMLERIVCCK
ncbi:dual specificity protein kinase zak2 [Topomyia yanbarensis]|uniref:dual specificity protein kinase zak2 n=1 Tax=Topomyia yanbarensis TaxID=2498891 RepID=UPI00273C268F|nr:dual specificity protein kinase zak2 [Topomyia yanbarensis]